MKLAYTVTHDDLAAFQRHATAAAAAGRRMKRFLLFVVPAMIFGSVLLTPIIGWAELRACLLAGAAGTAVYIVLLLALVKRQNDDNREDAARRGLFGPQEMELTDERLTTRSEGCDFHRRYKAILRVDVTATHAFVFISETWAHPVGRSNVREGDFDRFFGELSQRVASAARTP